MKLVIYTQIKENYGTADKPYWKFKGGETYIVPNLTVDHAVKIGKTGIPTLISLIESRNPMFEEYVQNWALLDDDVKVCEPWESLFELRYIGDRWVANRTVDNGEYGYMNSKVERKTEEYDMLMGGERGNYRVVYTMRNGDMVTGEQVNEYLNKAA